MFHRQIGWFFYLNFYFSARSFYLLLLLIYYYYYDHFKQLTYQLFFFMWIIIISCDVNPFIRVSLENQNLFIAHTHIKCNHWDQLLRRWLTLTNFLSFQTIVTANEREKIKKILVVFLLNFDNKTIHSISRAYNGLLEVPKKRF